MKNADHADAEVSRLQAEIAALRADLAAVLSTLKDTAQAKAQEAGEKIDQTAHKFYDDMSGEAQKVADKISKQVEAQPVTALLVALGVGYVAGRILSGSRR